MRKYVVYTAALLAGILCGFFIVFNLVFSDKGDAYGEIAAVFLLIVAVYGFCGAALGFFLPGYGWINGLLLSLPAIVLVGLYSFRESGQVVFNMSVLLLTIASTWLGIRMGEWLSQQHRKTGSRPR